MLGRCCANRGLGDEVMRCGKDHERACVHNYEKRLHLKCRWVGGFGLGGVGLGWVGLGFWWGGVGWGGVGVLIFVSFGA